MSAYPSLLSPLMNAQGLITTSALNTDAQNALAAGVEANARLDVLEPIVLKAEDDVYQGLPGVELNIPGSITTSNIDFTPQGFCNGNSLTLSTHTEPYKSTSFAQDGNNLSITVGESNGIVDFNSGNVGGINELTCSQLNYTTLNPPIVPGATPSLSQVLTVSGNGGNKPITNVETIYANNVITSGVGFEAPQIAILKQNQSGYYYQTSNASGVDLNTKFTSDGLILHKVSTGSDITIQNDANNLITLGTSTGYADLKVGVLNYESLNPAIVPSATPTLSEVLTAGNTASADINMNASYKIYNALELRATTVEGTTQVITPLLTNDIGVSPTVKLGTTLDANNKQILNSGAFNATSVETSTLIVGGTQIKPVVKPTYTYFVAKGGSDSGTGTLSDPYLTIGRAIQVCEAVYDGNPRVINVLAGSYTENITLTKSRISIVGEGVGTHPDVGTSIIGSITVELASGTSDLNNNNITISGFLLVSLVEDSTAGDFPHRLMINNCHIYGSDRCLYMHPVFDYRCFVSNCIISNEDTVATNPLIECGGSGMVSFNTNQITAKGASQNVFKLTGTCRIDAFALNILTSASTGTNVAIAIFVHNSTQTITLGQNAFIYSSSGAKRNVDTASGIYMSGVGGSLVIVQNFFSLTGLPTGQNAVQNNSTGGVVIFGSNTSSSSTAGTSAFAISGTQNVSKFSMTSVQ